MSSQMHTLTTKGDGKDEMELESMMKAMSSAAASAVGMEPTESDYALELKSAPKQTCIPMSQRRLASSETSVNNQRTLDYDMPDKSWSVLYFGAKGKTYK